MFHRILLSVVVLGGLAAPLSAQSGPSYVLEMDDTVPLGGDFNTCITAPGGSFVFLLVSANEASIPTKFGTLCVAMPALKIFTLVMPASGHLCFSHHVDCVPEMAGFTGYFQFVALGPDPGQAGVSNCEALTAIDTGKCLGVGSFVTFTQGGWGTKCAGNNPGCLRDQWFGSVFPGGLLLGDQDGVDGDGHYVVHLTTSKAVEDFLPEGGTPAKLGFDAVNPKNSGAGVLGGQLAAAKLNVHFDDAGAFAGKKTQTGAVVGDLVFAWGVHAKLLGFSLREVITLADRAIAGEIAMPIDIDNDGTGDLGFSDLSTALDVANNNFDNGTQNNGNLKLP